MPANLLYHITDRAGTWFQRAEDCAGGRLRLTRPDDAVTLTGPLTVNVSLVAENVAKPLTGGDARTLAQEVYSYTLDIPAGYAWTCSAADVAPAGSRGANAGWGVILRPGILKTSAATQAACDVPCDFAVADLPDTSAFFPAPCEGCPPGSTVRTLPTCGPAQNVPPARGGCVRPRFYNGMLMTREDMETQLRYARLKNRLHNRAAGAGVVWGLAVGRCGGKVRVEAGYAVDCCGNDLAVTCPYEVDVATLLSDPAVCRLLGQGPQRLHLLLEYVECPEEPRPVHGDVCSPQTTLCEPSRVRETVRLRLVPPRDWTPDGPIGKFLGQVVQTLAAAPKQAAATPAAAVAPGDLVPFTVTVSLTKVKASNPPPGPLVLRPVFGGSVQGQLQGLKPQDFWKVTILLQGQQDFVHGQVVQTAKPSEQESSTNLPNVTAPVSSLSWSIAILLEPAPGQTNETDFAVLGWQTAAAAGGTPVGGNTQIRLALKYINQDQSDMTVTVITDSPPPVPGPWPCLTEACDPQGSRLFPVLPPWSHSLSGGSIAPADPLVLAAALAYAILALDAGRYQSNEAAGTAGDVQQLSKVHDAVLLTLLPQTADADRGQILEALHQLFRDWCEALLYRGPTCQGDPHGVVIGCALVSGGDICELDSWGGRRWVVHYPLLSHWLEQFGVTPPDVLASRVFDLICCIAEHLRTPPAGLQQRDGKTTGPTKLTTAAFNVQGSYLMFGSAQDAQAQFEAMGVKVNTKAAQTLGLLDFLGRVTAVVRGPQQSGSAYDLYTVSAFPTVYLAAVSTGAIGRLAAQPARVAALVQPVLAPPAAVPPLLRDFAGALTAELLNAVPLGHVGANNPAVAPLEQAGLTTVGAVLARDPEALLGQVLKGGESQPLSALLAAGENLAGTAAKAVAEVIQKHQARGLLTRGDFAKSERVGPFLDDLTKALGNAVPGRDAVAAAVDRASAAAPGANA
jgi:hypothetical protein